MSHYCLFAKAVQYMGQLKRSATSLLHVCEFHSCGGKKCDMLWSPLLILRSLPHIILTGGDSHRNTPDLLHWSLACQNHLPLSAWMEYFCGVVHSPHVIQWWLPLWPNSIQALHWQTSWSISVTPGLLQAHSVRVAATAKVHGQGVEGQHNHEHVPMECPAQDRTGLLDSEVSTHFIWACWIWGSLGPVKS